MLKIDMLNIQSIGEATIILEDNSITEFVGDNSNGKSIISKVVEHMTKGSLTQKRVRKALIKRGTSQGVILFTYNKKQLGLVLGIEVSDSYVMYVPNIDNEDEKILRNINDKTGYDAMLKKFGFRTYSNGDICLQLAPTFGAIPFITTSYITNGEIVDDVTKDKIADEFLNSFKSIAYPMINDKLKTMKRERESAKAVLESLESYDWRAYENIYKQMSDVYNVIGHYIPLQLSEIPIPPSDDLVILPEVNLREIPTLELCNVNFSIEDISSALNNYLSILNRVCPTCGKTLIDL